VASAVVSRLQQRRVPSQDANYHSKQHTTVWLKLLWKLD